MEFVHSAHEAAYSRVRAYMTELFGEAATPSADEPSFVLHEGSAVATVTVRPWREHATTVETASWVVTETSPSEELFRFLLTENTSLLFGAFGLQNSTDVIFKHSIVGDTLDKEELQSSVEAVLEMADQYDDEIVQRFGGLRAKDRPAPASE